MDVQALTSAGGLESSAEQVTGILAVPSSVSYSTSATAGSRITVGRSRVGEEGCCSHQGCFFWRTAGWGGSPIQLPHTSVLFKVVNPMCMQQRSNTSSTHTERRCPRPCPCSPRWCWWQDRCMCPRRACTFFPSVFVMAFARHCKVATVSNEALKIVAKEIYDAWTRWIVQIIAPAPLPLA